jgi:hypothetical protein
MDTILKSYIVAVCHDNGLVRIQLVASSPKKAREIVTLAEGCPLSAIGRVRLKTNKSKK